MERRIPTRRQALVLGGGVLLSGAAGVGGGYGVYKFRRSTETPRPISLLRPEDIQGGVTHTYRKNSYSIKGNSDGEDTASDRSTASVIQPIKGLNVIFLDLKAFDPKNGCGIVDFVNRGADRIRFGVILEQSSRSKQTSYTGELSKKQVKALLSAENHGDLWAYDRLRLFLATEQPKQGKTFDNVVLLSENRPNRSSGSWSIDKVPSSVTVSFLEEGIQVSNNGDYRLGEVRSGGSLTFFGSDVESSILPV